MSDTLTKAFFKQKHVAAEVMNLLAIVANEIAFEHGFHDELYPIQETLVLYGQYGLAERNLIDAKLSQVALIMSELGEMVEGIRKGADDEHLPEFTSEEVEAADAIIRILDYAGEHNLRIGAALVEKMEYNMGRPYKHGKKA